MAVLREYITTSNIKGVTTNITTLPMITNMITYNSNITYNHQFYMKCKQHGAVTNQIIGNVGSHAPQPASQCA